jgi:hypothetical protein
MYIFIRLQLYTDATLNVLEKKPRVPLKKKLRLSKSRYGHAGEEKESLSLIWIRNHDRNHPILNPTVFAVDSFRVKQSTFH